MRLIRDDERISRWIADRAPLERPEFRNFVGLGILRSDGEVVAGVVFSDWHPNYNRIEFSGAVDDPRCVGPRMIIEIGEYAFGQLDCFRVWARTSVKNDRARRFLKGIGFVAESTEAHWYGHGHHAVQYRMIRPEFERRWHRPLRKAA